ncbi:hypothetical protein [Candidatus Nanohalovita haloferacivicina]|uniref:hypothetical protein n=1 Tax=Candidatus Nanohalovita haloferacivicina TaxID=2978046 RepID=UPI00325FA04A|nr:hypothetical protein HBNXNv_0121 [Candidatus Nanohalobia archaeon BNXNv]
MDVQTSETEEGLQIDVYTDQKAAIVVRDPEERIYLPENASEAETYYTEDYQGLVKTDFGYRLLHKGEISDFKVLA